MSNLEHLKHGYLPSGTIVDTERHQGPGGIGGYVAHWGEIWEREALDDEIKMAYGLDPNVPLPSSGFEYIYRQGHVPRKRAIEDELCVADTVVAGTLEANGWKAEDVDALIVGSGVPPLDTGKIKDYAVTIAIRSGLRPNIYAHNTHAACASGGDEFFNALLNPSLQGKKVLVLGMESVTSLTPDFDPKMADSLSMQLFSNGAAGIGIIPGEDITIQLINYRRLIVPDTRGALAAKMTYEDKLDPESNEIWQENGNTSMIRVPVPENNMLLRMKGKQTAAFFVRAGAQFIDELYQKYTQKNPEHKIPYIISHYPSEGVCKLLREHLEKRGVTPEIPKVIHDGNASAATTIIAINRLLHLAIPGSRAMVVSYGAGGVFVGGIVEYLQRKR